jgi:hypothetical protein
VQSHIGTAAPSGSRSSVPRDILHFVDVLLFSNASVAIMAIQFRVPTDGFLSVPRNSATNDAGTITTTTKRTVLARSLKAPDFVRTDRLHENPWGYVHCMPTLTDVFPCAMVCSLLCCRSQISNDDFLAVRISLSLFSLIQE